MKIIPFVSKPTPGSKNRNVHLKAGGRMLGILCDDNDEAVWVSSALIDLFTGARKVGTAIRRSRLKLSSAEKQLIGLALEHYHHDRLGHTTSQDERDQINTDETTQLLGGILEKLK